MARCAEFLVRLPFSKNPSNFVDNSDFVDGKSVFKLRLSLMSLSQTKSPTQVPRFRRCGDEL